MSGNSTDISPTPGAYASPDLGSNDTAIFKLTPAFDVAVVALLGGSANDHVDGISVDARGRVLMTGETQSGDFPVTANAFRSSPAGDHDAVVTVLDNDLASLLYSTYIGGSGYDLFRGCYMDPKGSIYGAGASVSSDFPTLDPEQNSYAGSNDSRWGNGDAMLVVFRDRNLFDGDSDGNFLPDAWEIENFGSIGQDPNADPDGDLGSNRLEYLHDTDPNDPTSALRIGYAGGTRIRLMPMSPLVDYDLRWSRDLAAPPAQWSRLNMSPVAGQFVLPDLHGSPIFLRPGSPVFFKVLAEPAF